MQFLLFLATIFNFTFNPYALISLLAFLLTISLLVLLYAQKLQTTTIRWLKLVLLTAVFWSFSEMMNRFSATSQAGSFWDMISWPCFILISPFSTGFATAFIRKDKVFDRFLTQLAVFGLPILFLFLAFTTNTLIDRRFETWRLSYYGQWIGPTGPLFTYVVLPWIDFLAIFNIILIYLSLRKTKDLLQRKQAEMIITGFVLPLIGASITNGLFRILQINSLEIGVPVIAISCLIFTYGMIKYRLFIPNPATIATNIVDTMNELLFVLNPEHSIEFVNNAAAYVLGYDKHELEGQTLSMLLRGDEWHLFQKIALEPIEKGIQRVMIDYETSLRTKDGDMVPVRFSVSPYKDPNGKIVNTICVVSDIRKLRELSNITAERDNLSVVMESITDGVLAVGLDNRVIRANAAASHILQIGQNFIVNKSVSSLFSIVEDENTLTVDQMMPLYDSLRDVTVQKNNIQIVAMNGKRFPAHITISVIPSSRKAGLGSIIIISDLSKELELEEMKADFISMAVHELRTPLTSIKGYLSVFLDENKEKLDQDQRYLLERVDLSTKHLELLVGNLLNVSRIESGTFELKIDNQVQWGTLVMQLVQEITPRAQEKQISISSNVPSNLPLAVIDSIRMGEVLSNLLANAINYTDKGGSITVTVSEQDGIMTTSVTDTGRGIPQDAISRLFSKFYRVKEASGRATKGSGLGLFISKAIVEMHGGKIWVESEVGRGSTFIFTFPLQPIKFHEEEELLPLHALPN